MENQNYNQNYDAGYNSNYNPNMNVRREDSLPPEYKPLSPWAYFGYNILFAIPILGLIFLFIYAFSDENINRRNYARSFFCALLIGLILAIIMIVLAIMLTGSIRY